MAHCQYFPLSIKSFGEGIIRGCDYVTITIVSECRRAKLGMENSKMADLFAPGNKSVVFTDEVGVYVTDETVYADDEFPVPVIHKVSGNYDRGATFSFSVTSDAFRYDPGLNVSLGGCDSYITIPEVVFDENKKFVSGVSPTLLQAVIDCCGGREW